MEMKPKDCDEQAEILKILGNPIRLCIVSGLMKKGSCNVTYMEECLNVSQSSISQHLSKLKSAGIVKGYRTGSEIYYEVISKSAKKVINAIFEEEEQ
ncbi:ArsR/SmtB family transcription factor [Acetobacterium woodii]|uniref:Transcriptional regulator ArsR family n=1 Tax=Acetobacterium woodii (strain ATCC 29683 / DSM 1030 / JCM 2381 / KCTC 1655 / WB1) TaxID=931626 RepID=H6LCZ5_ACEWD|nr:metalloregulator ArsR/SmtB family transcription factor [Acetobacterium woodii]AFA47834.1 transcriptional regulator ArsR family [Acetobacterium woodii DSM 1030]